MALAPGGMWGVRSEIDGTAKVPPNLWEVFPYLLFAFGARQIKSHFSKNSKRLF